MIWGTEKWVLLQQEDDHIHFLQATEPNLGSNKMAFSTTMCRSEISILKAIGSIAYFVMPSDIQSFAILLLLQPFKFHWFCVLLFFCQRISFSVLPKTQEASGLL